MKQVLLLRHAKSSWDHPGMKDFARPLNDRGQKDAPKVGKFLKEIDFLPDKIYSSPAERAIETITLVAKSAGLNLKKIIWEDDLYFGSPRSYFDTIRAADNEDERIMLVGHNPLIEETIAYLLSRDSHLSVMMPTAAIVCLEANEKKWKNIEPGSCTLKWHIIPKALI
jgi:phosphohistidine phosphatase